MVDCVMTAWLSPNIQANFSSGTPIAINDARREMLISVPLFATPNSEPKVAVSTVDWSLQCQSTGVWLTKDKTPSKDLPVTTQCMRLASSNVVVRIITPLGGG